MIFFMQNDCYSKLSDQNRKPINQILKIASIKSNANFYEYLRREGVIN
jgi:hypothetical protein